MVLNNFVVIKGYEAGKGGNMLVSLDENLLILDNAIIDYKGRQKSVTTLICTAIIKDEKVIDSIAEMVDQDTPANRVIVVSKKFTKLPKKRQLALLEIQNSAIALESKFDTSNMSRRAYGEICAIERYGKLAVRCAVKKERKVLDKSIAKASKGLHWGYKKNEVTEKFTFKKLKGFKKKNDEFEDDFEDDFEDIEKVDGTVEPVPSN